MKGLGTIHTPDYARGRDENDDLMYGLCGQRVRLGDMKHWYGLMEEQVNCKECLAKRG